MPAPLTLSLRQPPDSLNCILDLWPHASKSYWLFHIQWPLHYQITLAASITDCYPSRCCSTHLMFLFPSHNALYSHPCQGRASHKYYVKYSICREMYSWKYTTVSIPMEKECQKLPTNGLAPLETRNQIYNCSSGHKQIIPDMYKTCQLCLITSERCLFKSVDIQCNASIRVASHSVDNCLNSQKNQQWRQIILNDLHIRDNTITELRALLAL